MSKRKEPEYSPEVLAQYTLSKHAPFECKDCEFVAKSEPSLVMHHRRMHGGMMAPGQNGTPNTSMLTKQAKYGKRALVANEIPPVNGSVPEPEVREKRKWTRRTPVEPVPVQNTLRYCPCCGTDILKLQTAMELIK